MRIIHFSDTHLNKENLIDLKDYFMTAILDDLSRVNADSPIDLVVISGDLVDRGGDSLGIEPYAVFRSNFIEPIAIKLKIKQSQFLIVPGNHDLDRNKIDEATEFFLTQTLDSDSANQRSEEIRTQFTRTNERQTSFKTFEKSLQNDNPLYIYSHLESIAVVDTPQGKIGFALINDSWRCSASLRKEEHFVGYKQLFRAKKHFLDSNTRLNIAIFHHPLHAINDTEREEVNNLLKSSAFDVALFGHSHRHEADNVIGASGGYLAINGRSAFDKPSQKISKYQAGYNLIDLDPDTRGFKLIARKFIWDRLCFDKDTDSLPDGEYSGKLATNERLYHLADDSNNDNKDLPNSYTADVDRIVSLLIGESIYPDKYLFIRELLQNSLDACNRVLDKNSYGQPRITIVFDTVNNSIQVLDEGDGMTKNTLKTHFSVIGKSISQVYNDNSGQSNLISKFGIGFISTFIVAQRVIIDTKHDEDERVIFEVKDVFKGFQYMDATINPSDLSGTSVTIYLKRDFDIDAAYRSVTIYCRHIKNLDIKYNSANVQANQSWNTEDSLVFHSVTSPRYEVQLGMNVNARSFIASNSGFLISTTALPLLPFRFPAIIGGEVNFAPKGIDFDVSRTNIIPSQKSVAFQKEISSSLRKLFRDGLELGIAPLRAMIVNYLYYYLQHYDNFQSRFNDTYLDFYSKKELISICSKNTFLLYNNQQLPLNEIIALMKSGSIETIYFRNFDVGTDYQAIVIQYLMNRGHLIVRTSSVYVAFHDAPQEITSLISIIQTIAIEDNITIRDIKNIRPEELVDMKLEKKQFQVGVQELIRELENTYSVEIEIGKFGSNNKAMVRNVSQLFLNLDHKSFQSFLEGFSSQESQASRLYLLGLLNLELPLLET